MFIDSSMTQTFLLILGMCHPYTSLSLSRMPVVKHYNMSAIPGKEHDEKLSPVAEAALDNGMGTMFLVALCTAIALAVLLVGCFLNSYYSDKPRLKRFSTFLGPKIGEEKDNDPPTNTGLGSILFQPLNIMIILMPLAWLGKSLHWGDTTVFLLSLGSMLPLASLMGEFTEDLAAHTGPTIGGLLNATFGNAVEMILVVQSLRQGLIQVTKGTLLGSILANELLVLGMAFLFGGLFREGNFMPKHRQQTFASQGAMVQAQLLLFSAFSIAMPTMFKKAQHVTLEHSLETARIGSIFTLLGYLIFLVFQLFTHDRLMLGDDNQDNVAHLMKQHKELQKRMKAVEGQVQSETLSEQPVREEHSSQEEEEEEEARVSATLATFMLFVATLLVCLTSECLVHAIEGFTQECGFSKTFVGVVLLPIAGNACEHATAIIVAMKDKVTLSIGIALGSTIQISLLVVPFAVLVSWFLDQPMDLYFQPVNAWALLLSALLVICVLATGKSNWLNGTVLIAAYCLLATLFFFSPDSSLM